MPSPDPRIADFLSKAKKISRSKERSDARVTNRFSLQPGRPINPNGFSAFRALYPNRPSLGWAYLFVGCWIGYGLSCIVDLFAYDQRVFATAIIAMILWWISAEMLFPVAWYFRHRRWPNGSPIETSGWDACIGDSHVLRKWRWRNIRVEIQIEKPMEQTAKALEAAIFLLKRQIDKDAIRLEHGDTNLYQGWTIEGNAMKGSANNMLLGRLVEFFDGPLTQIARSNASRVHVTMTPQGGWFFARPAYLDFSGVAM